MLYKGQECKKCGGTNVQKELAAYPEWVACDECQKGMVYTPACDGEHHRWVTATVGSLVFCANCGRVPAFEWRSAQAGGSRANDTG